MTEEPKKTKHDPPKPRNPLHDHPLLRKGGKHGKSRKAQRRSQKITDQKQTDRGDN